MTPQPPRLLLDEHIWSGLGPALAQFGYDAVHIIELGRRGASDESILELAASQGRVVLTFNSCDYMPLAGDWIERGQDHSGVILSPELPPGQLLKRTRKFLESVSDEDMRNMVRWLSDFRME